MIWDFLAEEFRPAPSEAAVDALLLELAPRLAAIGTVHSLRLLGDLLAIVVNGDEIAAGGKSFERVMRLFTHFVGARVAQIERADALTPDDVKRAGIQ